MRPKVVIGKIDTIIMNTCDSDANPIDSGCLNGIDLRPFTQNWSIDTGILNTSRLDADLPGYSASGCLFLRPFPVNGQLMMSIQYNSKLDAERPGCRYYRERDLRPQEHGAFSMGEKAPCTVICM